MVMDLTRDYNCKDEDVPHICNFAESNLNHDLAVFTGYSPKFNQEYLTRFGSDIAKAFEIVEPQAEIQLQKIITDRIFGTLDSLIDAANRLSGYSKFSNMSLVDLGIYGLRKAIHDRNAEGATDSLHVILRNIANFKEQLTEQGLTDDLIAKFETASATLKEDKKKQYEIFSNRMILVQNNIDLFNGLFKQLNEILMAGKILYKSDPAKRKEYTLSELKKRVSRLKNSEPKTGEVKVEAASEKVK